MAETKQRFITIDGVDISVTEEVYREYKRPAWAERKRRKVRAEKERSLEAFTVNGYEITDNSPSVDKIVEETLLIKDLHTAIDSLNEDDRALIETLFFKGISERELSKMTGIPRKTIAYRKEKALKILRCMLNDNN